YGANDPDNLKTLPPYSAYSPVSRLAHNALSGEHHDVKVTGEDAERLLAWIDTNGPYLGDEEIRAMYDPDSVAINSAPKIRPRIATAPKINRFDIRQDGDTSAFLPPLKLMPDPDPNFNPNERVSEVQMRDALEEVKRENIKVEILAANYGIQEEDQRVDVTDKVKERFNGSRMLVLGNYNELFGDPTPNQVKTLRVAYRINGGDVRHVSFNENERVLLPKN
ncbi:MAG: hypothetical protein IJL92_06760, partial [Thermoguttaceae bacterium]|nr:hypothetical protein [Thermoguttaceae bacterium]